MKTKTVGHRLPPQTPAECHAAAARLYRSSLVMNPWPRPRGFVFKARTWEQYAAWRAAHENPWLW